MTRIHAAAYNLKVISEWLGHSGIAMTANTYLRVRKPQLGEAAAKLEALFRGKGPS